MISSWVKSMISLELFMIAYVWVCV
jgi:hypothetical protein